MDSLGCARGGGNGGRGRGHGDGSDDLDRNGNDEHTTALLLRAVSRDTNAKNARFVR